LAIGGPRRGLRLDTRWSHGVLRMNLHRNAWTAIRHAWACFLFVTRDFRSA